MDYYKYKREIELMKKQNPTEYDMYSLIIALIREGENVETLSVRDVSKRQRSQRGQVFYGLSGIPDIVILDEEFDNRDNNLKNLDNKDKIYGCVEVKDVNSSLLSIQDILDKMLKCSKEKNLLNNEEEQILGEILWFKKVLYTNGVRWRYIECEYKDQNLIKKLVKARIKHDSKEKEKKKELPLERFKWCNNIDIHNLQIKEEDLLIDLYNCTENDWKEFVDKLHHMKWK